MWNQATPPAWDPEIAGGAAFIGPGDDGPSKTLLLSGTKAIDDEAELLVSLDITLAHEAGVWCPLDATIWEEVHATFELAVAVLTGWTALSFGGDGVCTERSGAQHSTAIHPFPSCLSEGHTSE